MDFQELFLNSLKTSTALTKSLSLIEHLPESIKVSQEMKNNLPYIQAYKNITCSYPYYYASQNLNSFSIILTESGSGTLSINNETIAATNDQFIIFNCRYPHKIEINQSNWNYKILFIDGSPISFLLKSIADNKYAIHIPLQPPVRNMFYKLFQMIDITKENSLQTSKLVLDMLYEIILENNKSSKFQTSIPKYIIEIKKDFDVNYQKDFSYDYLEREYHTSRYRLCREFNKYFYESPMQYLIQKRIAIAKDILMHTDKRINEVGRMIGLENTNHFIRLFKQKTGVTPLEYSKSHRL
ncbi:MAG: AraC family transcriptional regulator [Anaerocolumna sp.]